LSAALLGIYLTLAWIFSSWTRPIVVMAIIPFGLIGAIYGHAYWDVPLSMFSVVGLIGMTGIIINDSIVLVTTIDEYAEDRGMFPAIVDATTDRLRPVMLTTATTVLGLAPLLFERSADAQFLKPTVITLVYGLGFGMVIVLLMVPAILSMQVDVARYMATLRRAAQNPQRFGRASLPLGLGIAYAVVWFAITLGSTALFGALPQFLGGSTSMTAAIGVFLAGLAIGLLVIYSVAAFAMSAHARRTTTL
jgi:predicted RND superfamily exporter protein